MALLGLASLAPHDDVQGQTPTASDSRAADQEQQFNTYVDEGRFEAAAAFLARVDSLHIASREQRIAMHRRLMQGRSFDAADDTLRLATEDTDDRLVRQAADQLLHVLAEPPVVLDRAAYDLAQEAWWHVIRAIQYLHPDSLPALVARADADLARYGTVDTHAKQDWRWMLAEREDVPQVVWAHLTTAEKESAHDWHPPYYRIRGVWAAPRLQADTWIAPPGRPANDTVRPVPGKVNLICTVGEATDEPGHAYSAAELAGFIRHWVTKYGTQNLEVTIVWPETTQVRVYHPPWGNATLQFASPAAAAGWYLQDYLHLPVTVAVQASHPQAVVAPDGQMMTVPRLQFNAFWAHDPELVRRRWEVAHLPNRRLDRELLRPAEAPGTCAIIGRDGTMEHTSIQADYLVNTRWAMRLLFEGPGAPPRPRIGDTRPGHRHGPTPPGP